MAALLALCGLLVAAHLQHSHASALSAAPSPGFTLHDTANQEYAVPEGLLIGAGTSALQTEGAVSEGGRGESNVDHVLHDGKIFPGGPQHYHDTAADSYHRYKEDVAMAVALKLKLFRFSFSWTRLLPTANASEPNLEGVKHYHDVIKEITDNGLTPMVTLYHFDHPQILEDEFKGWMGEEMVDKFEEYARFVFDEYASEVKLWVTINEPNVYCTYFVLPDPQDPTKDLSKERFRCMRTNILAHAKAYKAFKDGKHEGLVGFSAHTINARPNSTSPEDVYAAEAFNQFQSGASLQPVVSGDYPQIVKDLAAGTVIPFSEEEKKLIKNTADFIGLNVYYGMVASYKHDQSDAGGEGGLPAYIAPGKFGLEFLPFVSTVNDIKGDVAALYSENNPSALRTSLLWVWQSYKVPIFITENGFADIESLGLRDAPRAAYHSSYLRTLLKTIKDFNVKVLGYCAWSLIDAYEWSGVYSRRFGLVYVDYDGKLDRSLKDSKDFWIAMAENKVVPLVALSSASTQSVSLAALGAALALAWLASRSS